jgi:molecular chaperone GrpE
MEDSWFEGIELVQRKLSGILESLSVKEIEAVGEPFDPNFHDALAQEPSDVYESGIVTREMIKGYQIGDKVVRPSLVYVAE